MDLAVPVAHWLCIDKINKILRCVCFTCGALLIDRKDPKIIRRFSRYQKSKTNRLTVISTFCKGRTCIASHDGVVCGAPQPVYARSGPYLTCTFPEGTVFESEEEEKWSRRKFTAAIARDILSNISDEDCEFIGLNPKQTRPEWLILVTISVPPPLIRPTTSISDGSRTKGHDDLTSLLREISKYNMKLKELQKQYAERVQQGTVTPEYEKEYQKLFDLNKHELVVQLAVYFDKDGGAGTSQMSLGGTGVMRNTRSRQHLRNGPLRSLGKRMGGKKGRIRTSVLGKRVDHCARSVITPDPFVDIHELVVPQIVVKNQTLPETVNRLNIADLKRRVCRGFHQDGGGVLKIQRPNGSEINLDILRDKPEDLARISKALLPGWVVHRQVKNGDWCVFNRQPTLHKMGMMGHKIRIIPTDPSVFHGIQCTFGLPVPTTSPYNADYDGDEMNLHLPQNFASQSETKHLMAVPFQILSPKDSKPCMGAVQDSVIGSFKLTSKDTFLTRPDFFEYMMCSKYADDPRAPPPAIFYRNDRGEWDVLFTGKQLASYITPKGITFTRKTRGLDGGGMSACMDVEERFVVFQDGTLLAGQLDKQTVGSVNRGIMHRTCIQHGPWRACYWVSDLQRIACKFIGHYGFSIGMVDCLHSSATQKRIDNVIDASISAVIEGGKRAEEAGVDPSRIEGEKMRVLQNVLNDTARIVLESVKHDNVIWECITSGSKGKKLNYTQIHALVSQQSVSGQRLKYRTDPEARSLPCFDDSDKDHPFARGFCANSYLKGLTPVEMFFHCAGGREGMIDTACKTAETGYLQRRMGKILESEHACADTSVRDSHGHIIVRRYGGDGMACEKLLKTTIRILGKKGTAADLARRWCGGISVESEALETSITDVRTCLIKFNTNTTSSTLYLPFDPNDHIPPPSDTAWDPVSCRKIVAATERAIVSIVGHEESCGPMFLALRSTYVSSRLRGATAEALKECLDEIVAYVRRARVQNGDMLGIIAAQSIGEPATQMTLNSVEYNTDLVIRWKQQLPMPQNACVGETIDALLKNFEHRVQFPTPDTAYLPLEKGVAEALTVDDDGNASWKTLEAVTRHPPINKDGSNTLVKITTRSGRTVTATKAKSFLVVEEGKVVTKEGSELKVEDKIPVLRTLPTEDLTEVDLRVYLDPKQYIFTTTMESAYSAMRSTPKRQSWFEPFSNLLPYSRSDSCRVALEKFLYLRIPGFVYTKMHNETTKGILEKIVLNRSFGFFVGAYLAEGCCTEHQIHIANTCLEYRQRAAEWPSSLGIQNHLTNEKNQMKNNGVSISIMFHSTLLSTLMKTWCNQGSWNKRVPHFAYSAPRSFIIGLLDGYLSGDGTVHKNGSMNGSSRSKALIEGISLLLTRLEIPSTLGSDMVMGSLQHRLYITIYDAQKLHSQMTFCVPMKEQRLQHVSREKKRRKKFKQNSTLNDVFVDPVVKIEEVVSEHPYVYDLTVSETRNMVTASGLTQRDTFHTAGTGNKTVQRGVPRFKEIIDCAKRLKTPSMDIYLAPPVEGSLGIAKKLTRQLTEYRLSDFVMAYDILYEPIVNETDIPGDRNAVRAYYDVSGLPKDFCLYVSRIVIDKQKLIKKYLCIDQICNAVRYHVKEKGEVMSTTYADDEWVVRVRLCKMSSFSKINNSGVENDSLEIHHAIAHEFCDGIIDDVRISGLAGVEAYVAGYTGICLETNEPLSNKYMVETSGSHLRKILSSGNLIDSTRTVSNDVNEILKCLGVEAAQTVIFKETLDVLCDGGDSMAPHHLWLLSMKMTFTGEAQPVTRHGMIKTGQTTIVKASFERTVDTFIDAAVHGVRDECRGVTESIVTGRLAPVGTGCNIDIYEIHGNTTTKKDVEKKKETTICDEEFIGRRKRRWREEETHPPIYDWITCPRERFKLNRLRNTNRTTTPPPDIMFDSECSMNWNTMPTTPPMISEDGPNTPPEDFEPQTPPCTPTVSEDEEGDDDEITDTSPLYVPSSPVSTNKDIDKKNTWTVTLGSPHYVSNFNVSEWEVRLESPTKDP